MPETQNFKNHTRRDPVFMAVLLAFAVDIVLAIYYTIAQWPRHSRSHLWWIVLSIAWFLLAGLARSYATKNQDRIIRLEESLRYAALLSTADLARTRSLTTPQIVALRFASDAELPALFERTLAENLAPKQIKQIIVVWRPDHNRV